MMVHETTELWCEPGRALVAEASSLLTRVDLRKGDSLYLNDGAYGSLFDAAHSKWPFPVKLHRAEGAVSETLRPFRFYGPTCDSVDVMPGPFWLPEDVREGDYIEVGMLGAYGSALATRFNGFGESDVATMTDAPMASMFGLAPRSIPTPRSEPSTVVKLSKARGKKRRRR
jgi:ornithine decarboxylase